MIKMMMGAYIMEEIWWDGTDLMQVGNHCYFISEDGILYRVYTDITDHVDEIEEV